jgi:hypothetical protein
MAKQRILRFMHASAQRVDVANDDPVVINQSTDRSGSTFALDYFTERALKERFGDKLHPVDRIFVAHTTHDAIDRLYGKLARQLLALLTGLDEDLLAQLTQVEFMDPVTERRLWPLQGRRGAQEKAPANGRGKPSTKRPSRTRPHHAMRSGK